MPTNTQFKGGVTALGDSLVSDQLEANLVEFFDWGFLQVGGFFSVTFPGAGTNLRMVSDPDYADGQVWEGYRRDWVWESGVPGVGTQPVAVSGVWVNGTFVARGTAGSGFHVNYPLGRVVFDSPLPPASRVACEFSFRRVQMATSDAEWFQELQFNTTELDQENQVQFAEVASGAWNVLAQNRIQLPAIVVEAVNRVRLIPLELGSSARVHQQDVLFHVLSDTPFDRKQLHDIIVAQWDHRIVLFDKNAVDDSDAWPLDMDGTPRDPARTFEDLVRDFRWRVMAVVAMQSEPKLSLPPLYRATCRATVELDLP
jgi:hypothetical protein